MIINRYLKWSPGHSETIGTASGCLSLPFFASERGHRCGTRRGATCAAREVRDALLKDASSCAMSSTQLSSPSETGWCTLTTLQGHGHDPKWDSKTVYPAIFGCFRLRVFPLYCLNIQFRIVAGSFWGLTVHWSIGFKIPNRSKKETVSKMVSPECTHVIPKNWLLPWYTC